MGVPEPGSNRHRVCVELRRSRADVPILVMTEKGGVDDEVAALDSGADDYLRKPYSHEVLLARLRALTRRSRRSGHPTLRIGDLWLDLARHRCGRGRRNIALTRREFAVLSQLAQHSGQVVSKAAILDEVWDMACEVNPAVVEVYISMLRRKIDAPFGVSSIETVRGSGYRLVPVAR
ncbi:DNA-binding response regulator, OmpR family, contains REC and winged-helix (wHTH) domain [Streptomyces sp. yr375]|nr:DNA-binding response regulator, OmpR family, contains REC and winged-helix (wHTH) domain [Streptomyces sp. yr375]